MQNEYIIAFSSFYKAAYAQEILEGEGIKTNLRKLPIEIARSCSTGLLYRGSDAQNLKEILARKDVNIRGIYLVDKQGKEKTEYVLVR